MPRPRNIVIDIQLEKLKAAIEKIFGNISSPTDCVFLSTEIKKATGQSISASTLRRLFGLETSASLPSKQTLHILAHYTGAASWDDFVFQASVAPYNPLTKAAEKKLYLDFFSIQTMQEGDMNYHNACRNIAFRILKSPALLDALAPAMAKNPTAQTFFFERFPFIDGLGATGRIGMIYQNSLQLYLNYKKDAAAQIFGNSLLALSAFLCNQEDELRHRAAKVAAFSLDKKMHPFTVARYFGTKVLAAFINNEDIQVTMPQIVAWNDHFLQTRQASFWHFPFFQFMMADYLNLAECYVQANRIIKTTKHINANYQIEQGYKKALAVVQYIAQQKTHTHKPAATQAMEEEQLSFLFENFYTLQMYCCCKNDKRGTNGRNEKTIARLIEKTGFIFFKRYL